LKITGVLDDDSFVEDARTNGTVKKFRV